MRAFIRGTVGGQAVRGYLPLYQRSSGIWHPITDDPVATAGQAEDLCIRHLVAEMQDLRADVHEVVERVQRFEHSLDRLRDTPKILDRVYFRGQETIIDGDGSIRVPGDRQDPGARASPKTSPAPPAPELPGEIPGMSGRESARSSGPAARAGGKPRRDVKWDASFGVCSRFAERLQARISPEIVIDAALVSLLRRVAGEYGLSPVRTLQMICDAVDNEPSEFILAVGEVAPEHLGRAAEFMFALCQARGARSVWARERERRARARGLEPGKP